MDVGKVYMILYIVCFVATIVAIMLAVIIGDGEEKREALDGGYDGYKEMTGKDWRRCFLKATALSALASIFAPLVLLLYAFIIVAGTLSAMMG